MLVSEIATRVKRQFGDEAGAQIKDEDIVRWVNDAQREIAVTNDLLQTLATTALIIDTGEYTLPPELLTLRNVFIGSRKLKGISTQEADEWQSRGSDNKGEPTHFWIYANKINLYPTPTATGDLKIYFTKQPDEIAVPPGGMTATPELPQQYHNRIVEYCIAQAYELDDNFESYEKKMQQFMMGMDKLKGNQEWERQDVYPSITVAAADAGDGLWGDFYG